MITAIRNAKAVLLLAVLFAVAPLAPAPGATSKPQVKVVAFGLFGDQDVFESEAKGAAEIAASRFGGGDPIVRFNSRSHEEATPETLATALQSAAKGIDAQRDILLVILTSHGSRGGVAVKTPSREGTLSPLDLFTMLDATHVRHRIVIISACFSGVFIPPLADPDTLVITAADADHPSFGCRNGNTWTYFGDAFFNMALRRTANLQDAFALASVAIRKRETQNHFEPSNPQMAGGENVERMLGGGDGAAQGAEDARYATAYESRGNAYTARGELAQALTAYDEALRLDPELAPAYADRGIAYRAKGDLNHALADANEAIMLDPKLAAAYNARGMVYFSKRDADRALADFSEAIRLDPKRFVVYTNRGMAFAAKGDNDQAITDFGASLKLEPRFYAAYYQRGIAFNAKGNNNRAIADFSQAIKLSPKTVDFFEKRAAAYRAKGDTAHSEADLKEAARLRASAPHP